MTIGSLAVNLIARTEKFTGPLRKARGEVGLMAGALRRVKPVLMAFGGALIGAAAAAAPVWAKTASDIDRVSKSARRLGVATESLVGLEHAAKLSDVSVGKLAQGLDRVNLMLDAARRGDKNTLSAFGRLGLDVAELKGLGADAVFGKIADAVARFPDAASKAGAAAGIFGKKLGPGLVDLLNQGSAGLAKMQADAEGLGLTFNKLDGEKIEEANDALTRVMESVKGLAREFTITLGPAVKKNADLLADEGKLLRGGFAEQIYQENYTASQKRVSMFESASRQDLTAILTNRDRDMLMRREALEARDRIDARAKANKLRSARAVIELPARLAGGLMGKFNRLAGDGADALGKLGSQARQFERGAMAAATRSAFGFGPFQAAGLKAPAGPGINDKEMMARIKSMNLGGSRAVESRGFTALERGTAAAYAQERRTAQQNQLVETAKESLRVEKEMLTELKNLKGTSLGASLLPANVA